MTLFRLTRFKSIDFAEHLKHNRNQRLKTGLASSGQSPFRVQIDKWNANCKGRVEC